MRVGLCILIVAAAAFPVPALAFGPYIWVDTETQVLFDADGDIAAFKEAWMFDEGFSAKVLDDIKKGKAPTTVDGLATQAKTSLMSLAEYSYFVFADTNGTKVAFRKPFDYFLEERPDKRLVLHFTLPLTQPTRAGKAFTVQIYDPAFFVAFDDGKAQPLSLMNAPAGCLSKALPGSETETSIHDNAFDKWRAYNVVSCPSQ